MLSKKERALQRVRYLEGHSGWDLLRSGEHHWAAELSRFELYRRRRRSYYSMKDKRAAKKSAANSKKRRTQQLSVATSFEFNRGEEHSVEQGVVDHSTFGFSGVDSTDNHCNDNSLLLTQSNCLQESVKCEVAYTEDTCDKTSTPIVIHTPSTNRSISHRSARKASGGRHTVAVGTSAFVSAEDVQQALNLVEAEMGSDSGAVEDDAAMAVQSSMPPPSSSSLVLAAPQLNGNALPTAERHLDWNSPKRRTARRRRNTCSEDKKHNNIESDSRSSESDVHDTSGLNKSQRMQGRHEETDTVLQTESSPTGTQVLADTDLFASSSEEEGTASGRRRAVARADDAHYSEECDTDTRYARESTAVEIIEMDVCNSGGTNSPDDSLLRMLKEPLSVPTAAARNQMRLMRRELFMNSAHRDNTNNSYTNSSNSNSINTNSIIPTAVAPIASSDHSSAPVAAVPLPLASITQKTKTPMRRKSVSEGAQPRHASRRASCIRSAPQRDNQTSLIDPTVALVGQQFLCAKCNSVFFCTNCDHQPQCVPTSELPPSKNDTEHTPADSSSPYPQENSTRVPSNHVNRSVISRRPGSWTEDEVCLLVEQTSKYGLKWKLIFENSSLRRDVSQMRDKWRSLVRGRHIGYRRDGQYAGQFYLRQVGDFEGEIVHDPNWEANDQPPTNWDTRRTDSAVAQLQIPIKHAKVEQNNQNELTSPSKGDLSPVKKWSDEECQLLVDGVNQFSGCWGMWAKIIEETGIQRTNVQLKDKWRNLTRYGRVEKARDGGGFVLLPPVVHKIE
eukprot:Lankesteria_metandrocarpae@DN1426_c0_g1_i1.p1